MQETEIMKWAQIMAAAMIMANEYKSQLKLQPNAVQQQEESQPTQQEESQPNAQQKKKLQFAEFRKFDNLRILTAKVDGGVVISMRKGKQFCAFLFTQEIAEALVELVKEHHPNISPANISPAKKGRGA